MSKSEVIIQLILDSINLITELINKLSDYLINIKPIESQINTEYRFIMAKHEYMERRIQKFQWPKEQKEKVKLHNLYFSYTKLLSNMKILLHKCQDIVSRHTTN